MKARIRPAEVLDGIEINSIPLEYMVSIKLVFKNGKIWDIPVDREQANETANEVRELISSYQSSIEVLDVKIDVDYLASEVSNLTGLLFKE
jgi:hypothetical protein